MEVRQQRCGFFLVGTWGSGIFDNDEAQDWVDNLVSADNVNFLIFAIQEATRHRSAYLDVDQGAAALAACEVLACLRGRWAEDVAYPQEVRSWVQGQTFSPSDVHLDQALTALERVIGDRSELKELWTDDEPIENEWMINVARLRERLTPG
jgi:hypothetical protein